MYIFFKYSVITEPPLSLANRTSELKLVSETTSIFRRVDIKRCDKNIDNNNTVHTSPEYCISEQNCVLLHKTKLSVQTMKMRKKTVS